MDRYALFAALTATAALTGLLALLLAGTLDHALGALP